VTGVDVSVDDLGLPGREQTSTRRRPGRGRGHRRPPAEPPAALAAAGRFAWRAGGPALAVTYLSLLVLLPLAALFTNAFSHGWATFWAAVTQPEAVAALELTLGVAAAVAVVNSVAGLVIAWVLVRDDFRGKALVSAVIDLPFALPTIVAGLTLLALYGPNSPFHVNLAGTRLGIAAALLFVTLPFCVRSVQPVLAELDAETEEAAASLGASHRQVLRRVILPSVLPAVLAGAGLAFARAVGEFGSVVLISGNLPFKTEVASSWIYSLTQSGAPNALPAASAVSVVLIAISLLVLVAIGWARRRFEVPETI
jgi:sulfate transport system permease protein